MKDNKLEYVITNEHPHRKEIIDQFYDLIDRSVTFNNNWKDMTLDLDIEMTDGTIKKESMVITKERWKENAIETINAEKQILRDAHGNDFGGKRIKFTMEVMDIGHSIEAEA